MTEQSEQPEQPVETYIHITITHEHDPHPTCEKAGERWESTIVVDQGVYAVPPYRCGDCMTRMSMVSQTREVRTIDGDIVEEPTSLAN